MKIKEVTISMLIAAVLCLVFGSSPIVAQETIKIGYVTPLTGPGSVFGLTAKEGFTLGLEDVNARGGVHGKKLEAIIYDSQGKPPIAATLAQRLILEDKVPLICMGSGSVDALTMMEVTERAKIPFFICASSSPVITEKGYKWVWRGSLHDKVTAEILGKYIGGKPDWNRIAVLYENSDLGRPPAEILGRIINESKGKQTVTMESFNRGDSDISGQLVRIKKANPDVLVIWGYHTEQALIARQKQQIGLPAQLVGNSTLIFPEYIKLGGSAVEGVMFLCTVSSYINPDPNVQAFARRYEEKFHRVLGLVSIENYNGAIVIGEVLKRVGTVPEKIQNALNTMTFQGVAGPMKFDSKGQCIVTGVIIAKVEGGKHKFMELFKVQ